jgi:PAS domain S-box-containing protein
LRRLWLDRLAWLPVPVLLAAMIAFRAAGLQTSHESPYLLLTLNIPFVALVCLVVAYLITRSFLIRGTPGLLLLGCGVVIWGPAGVVATAAARGDANTSITIYNSCVWLSGLCHLAGVSLSLRPRRSLSPPALWLPAAYALAVGAVILVTLSALAGWIPTFFVDERGGTPMRQIVLFSAIVMFTLTALLLGVTRRRCASAFAYWYGLALTLIATGLLGVMLQTYHASLLGWTGRATQTLGGLYMLIAAVVSVRESRVWGISLEAALQQSERRYRALVETAPDAIVVHQGGRFLYANSETLALVGVQSFEQLACHAVLDFFRPQDHEQARERMRLAMAGHRLPVREAILRRPDGQEIPVEFHTASLDFHGTPAVLTIIRDITERKGAEEALRRERSLLDSVMRTTDVMLVLLDPQFNFVWVNPAYAETCRMQPEEIVGRNHFDLYPHAENEAIFRRVRDTGEGAFYSDRPFIFPDQPQRGVTYWDWSLTPVKDGDGRVTGLVFSLRETTKFKRAREELQQALREAQQRCAETSALMACTRAVLEQRELVATVCAVFDACRKLLAAQAGYVAVLTPDEKYTKVLFLEPGGSSCTVDPSLPMPLRGLRAEAYRTGRVMYENDFARGPWAELLPPGHVRLENVLFAPLVVEGRTMGMLGLGNKPGGFTDHDATLAATFGELLAIALRNARTLESLHELNATLESKVAQRTAELERRSRQLQKLTLELTQAEDRERERIAALLHEDLQQHLAGAKFHLSALKRRVRTDPQFAVVDHVDEMLKEAIEKSRSLSHDLSPAMLHMNDLSEVLQWLAMQALTKHGLTVHVDVRGRPTLPSETLTTFLFRAAQEILLNVARHAHVEEATVRVRRVSRYLYLSVTDRGCGFDPQALRQPSGFGLLGIRERISLLGGRLKIRSTRRQGSTVVIALPCNGAPRAVSSAAAGQGFCLTPRAKILRS